MGEILSGKQLALTYKKELRDLIKAQTDIGKRAPSLISLVIGEDGGSLSYIKGQKKVSEEIGVKYEVRSFPSATSEDMLIEEIKKYNEDKSIDGIILQLPLPQSFDEEKVISTINKEKDVDGLTDLNLGSFYKGNDAFIPCTARGVLELIKSCEKNLVGKKTVVIGRSNIVGKPVATLLTAESSTVTICHSKTVDLNSLCKEADIIVSAIGRPGFITKEFVKEGAIIIDVGTTMVEGKVKGDVDFEAVIEKAKYVSPVPGGVGAMTTTMLMKNTCDAWLKNV